MAVSQFFRNENTRLEAGKSASARVCTRCRLNAVVGRSYTCGPCQVDAHNRRQEAVRVRGLARKQGFKPSAKIEKPQPESVHMLGRAARRAGLTVADLNAMDPPLSAAARRVTAARPVTAL